MTRQKAINQLTDRDTFRVDEIVQSSFDQLRKMIAFAFGRIMQDQNQQV